MQLASGTLASLHQLGPAIKAFVAGILGIGYLVAMAGLSLAIASEIAASGFFWGSPTPQLRSLVFIALGLVVFYAACFGVGVLNTGMGRALKLAFIGVISALLAWPVLGGSVLWLASVIYSPGCPGCYFLSETLLHLAILIPGLVPVLLILVLSIPMQRLEWRGLVFGVIAAFLWAMVLSITMSYDGFRQASPPGPSFDFEKALWGILFATPLAWALITYGTLRAKAPLESGQQEV